MMDQIKRIAIGQINTTIGDFSGNLAKIKSSVDRAIRRGAELICFPELAVCGYPPRDLLFRKKFLTDNLKSLEELIGYTDKIEIIVGYAAKNKIKNGNPAKNNLAWIKNHKIFATHSKNLLPSYDVFDETRHFEPGKSSSLINRILLTICEELWNQPEIKEEFISRIYPRQPLDILKNRSANIIINAAASPFVQGKDRFRAKLFKWLAKKYKTGIVFCNQVGGNDSLIFDGNSMIINSAGQIIKKAKSFEEDLLLFDFEELSATTPVKTRVIEFESEISTIYRALKVGLKDYLEKCQFERVVIGLSGGVDSSLSAAIAVDALGSQNVLGVLMPSEISSPESVTDARKLAKNLSIETLSYPIQEIFKDYLELLKDEFSGTEWGGAEENLQARIRGNILMALSNKFGHLLISNGNKSELAVGYCTLYGDMNGGLAILSDVPKTTVYQLANYCNKNQEIIPQSIIDRPPSAELSPGQIDQDDLPPYEILDEIIERYVERHQSVSQMVEAGLNETLVREMVEKINHNEYKRQQAPVGLKVTSKSFSAGWTMPIAQKFKP